jgi:hypothetical protein
MANFAGMVVHVQNSLTLSYLHDILPLISAQEIKMFDGHLRLLPANLGCNFGPKKLKKRAQTSTNFE